MPYFVLSRRKLGRNEVNISIVQSTCIVDIIQLLMSVISAQPHKMPYLHIDDIKYQTGL